MIQKKSLSIVWLPIFLFGIHFHCLANDNDFTERVKISLREVGNQLLLKNNDSTSIVLPVKETGKNRYNISFQNQLSIYPNDLVEIMKESFAKSSLPNHYRVSVIQCNDNEVGYSYEIMNHSEKDIIPCIGRILPTNCYEIEVRFTNQSRPIAKKIFLLLLAFLFLTLLYFLFGKRSRKEKSTKSEEQNLEKPITDRIDKENKESIEIGSYSFYPNQNKLIRLGAEESLSNKECEILTMLSTNINQVVKREELYQRIWEDNGVIVGRSLDTYISKLRKKLKDDERVSLKNIHGVGYKLIVIETG